MILVWSWVCTVTCWKLYTKAVKYYTTYIRLLWVTTTRKYEDSTLNRQDTFVDWYISTPCFWAACCPLPSQQTFVLMTEANKLLWNVGTYISIWTEHIPEDLDIYQHCEKLILVCCIHANTHMYMTIHFQRQATTKL